MVWYRVSNSPPGAYFSSNISVPTPSEDSGCEAISGSDSEYCDFKGPELLYAGLELSFSGLKTAVALEVARAEERAGGGLPRELAADLAASFQEAAIDVLCEKARRALGQTGLRRLAAVGGLAANSRLRERLRELCRKLDVELRFPPVALCTDNAAMIAAVADGMLGERATAPLDLEAFSRVPLGSATREGTA